MRVTEEKLLNVSNRVGELVEFLNVDFRRLPKFTREQIEVFWYALAASKKPKSAEKVQKDLRTTLIPLTNPRKRPSPEQAQRLMAGVIWEGKKIGFFGKWGPLFLVGKDAKI